jgi:hypothetical protein
MPIGPIASVIDAKGRDANGHRKDRVQREEKSEAESRSLFGGPFVSSTGFRFFGD